MSTRDRKDDEFAREIEAHLELEAAALMKDGLDPETARARARAAFGLPARRASAIDPVVLLRNS